MRGITSYAAYVPRFRLADARGGRSGRVVAAYDEDSTTLAAAAAHHLDLPDDVERLVLATTTPAYRDKTNATAVHAVLGLPRSVLAVDSGGAARSAAGAVAAAGAGPGSTVVVLSDVIVSQPGGPDEYGAGDGAAAFVFGEGPDVIASLDARVSLTEEFTDRWSSGAMVGSHTWEERFGLDRYHALVREAVTELLGGERVDHAVVVSPNSAVQKQAARLVPEAATVATSPSGHSGAASLGLALADVLDRAEPGHRIAVVSAADGCDAFLLTATDALATRRQPVALAEQLSGGRVVDLPTYWSWRGIIARVPPRRPEPDRVSAPAASRDEAWKFGLEGGRCTACGTLNLPPMRVCRSCGAQDAMETESVARGTGTIRTFTVDRLAFSPSPPLIDAVLDLDSGGRLLVEVADAGVDEVSVGARAGLSFRRLGTTAGIHNYYWKATLL